MNRDRFSFTKTCSSPHLLHAYNSQPTLSQQQQQKLQTDLMVLQGPVEHLMERVQSQMAHDLELSKNSPPTAYKRRKPLPEIPKSSAA